jgi:pimeloyl-ACP methyl ester carboxylesterase
VDALGIDKFYVEGGDRGSIPLWMFAALNPDRVLGLISENVSHLNGFFINPAIDQRRRSWYMNYFQFQAAEDALAADNWALEKEFFDYHPDMDHILADWERPNGLKASWLNWYGATMNPDTSKKMDPRPRVTVPVLLLYSFTDPYIGPEQLFVGRERLRTGSLNPVSRRTTCSNRGTAMRTALSFHLNSPSGRVPGWAPALRYHASTASP